MRVLVCGGRDFKDKDKLYRFLDNLSRMMVIDVVIEGDAGGADRMAGFWARSKKIDNLKFRADWQKYGRAAGPIRNKRMLEEGRPDLVVACPGGRGTSDMVQRAFKAGVPVMRVT